MALWFIKWLSILRLNRILTLSWEAAETDAVNPVYRWRNCHAEGKDDSAQALTGENGVMA